MTGFGCLGRRFAITRSNRSLRYHGRLATSISSREFVQAVGATTTGVEPSGNVRFTVHLTDLPGQIIAVTAEAL
jgi:hypothetical protein